MYPKITRMLSTYLIILSFQKAAGVIYVNYANIISCLEIINFNIRKNR